MITKQRTLFYFVGDEAFKSLEEAQKFDLVKLIGPDFKAKSESAELDDAIASFLLANSEAIVDILTTTPKSRLRGRKSHGATRKPRTPKATATQAAT